MSDPQRLATFGSLFAGIGGFDLGFERAGLRCLWQVEIDDYCQKILERHWPNTPRIKDIQCADASNLAKVDIITGGFPCQDISLGNNRGAGLQGERSGLWFSYARIIRELRPRVVVVENVPALRRRGLGRILGDLAESGYDAVWDGLPASAFGAHHVRDRLFVVAWLASNPFRQPLRFGTERDQWEGWRVRAAVGRDTEPLEHGSIDGWSARPALARVDNGPTTRMDRARWRVLGNAVLPQVSEHIARIILAADAGGD